MSYILDALRRADSEREQGAVPSLHSKQVPAGLADADEADARGRAAQPLWWAVAVLSLLLVAVVVWLLLGRTAPEAQPARAADPLVAAAPEPAPALAAAPVAPAPTTPAPVPQVQLPQPTPSAQDTSPAARPEPPPRAAPPARTPVERRNAAAEETAPTRAPAAAKPPRAERPVASAATPPRDEEAPVPSISELPDDIRRQLPALSVSGASYSKNPASRMLILNGQVFREGDKVANDLVLEQIRLKSAVLSFKGQRYSVSF